MTDTSLDKYNNDWYDSGPKLKRMIWYYTSIFFFETHFIPFSKLKVAILKFFGASVGKGVVLKPGVKIKYPWKLRIGDYTWIGEHVWIDNLAMTIIGNHVCISQGAMLLCGNHNYSSKTFDLMIGEIILEHGVWIGAKALVGPGVTCKSHSVLTAMSFTSRDLNPYSIYSGNPAQKVKDRVIK